MCWYLAALSLWFLLTTLVCCSWSPPQSVGSCTLIPPSWGSQQLSWGSVRLLLQVTAVAVWEQTCQLGTLWYPIWFCPDCSFKDYFALRVCWSFLSLGSSSSFLSWLPPWAPSSPIPVGCFLPNSRSPQQWFLRLGQETPSLLSCLASCAFSAKRVTRRVQNRPSACLWTCFLTEDACVSAAFF